MDNAIIGLIGVVIGSLITHFATKERDNKTRFKNQLPALVSLRLELRKIQSNFERLEQLRQNLIFDEGNFNYSQKYVLDDLNENVWMNIGIITDVEMLETLMQFKDFYINFREALIWDNIIAEFQLSNIRYQIDKLDDKEIKTDEDVFNIIYLINNERELKHKHELMILNKRYYWQMYLQIPNINEAKRLIEKTTKLIEDIKKIS